MSAVGYDGASRSEGWHPRRWWRAVRRFIFLVVVGFFAGAVAGFVAGGVGSRLAMRVVALVAGKEHYGELTEAEAIVGEITLDGTLFLLLFGTVIGVVGGLIYVVVRRWMPGSGQTKGLSYGVLLLAIFGSVIVDGDNIDFRLFVSSYLSVVLFSALFMLYGLIVAPIVERIDQHGGAVPAQRVIALAGYAVIGLICVVGLVQDVRSLMQIF